MSYESAGLQPITQQLVRIETQLASLVDAAAAMNEDALKCVRARQQAVRADVTMFEGMARRGQTSDMQIVQIGARVVLRGRAAVSEAEQCLASGDVDKVGRLAFGIVEYTRQLSKVSRYSSNNP